MRASCYLVLDRRGVVRMTKRQPELYAGEIAVKVNVSAADAHFRDPYAEASIEIGDDHLIRPEVDVTVVEPPVPETSEPDTEA
jgi:hypothetical protein